MDRYNFLNETLNEAVDETVTGFDDFKSYQSAANKARDPFDHASKTNGVNPKPKMIFVYHGTGDDAKKLQSMADTGGSGSKEFYGKAIGQVYGRGIYTMIERKDICVGNGAVVRYAVKPGTFDNFIIWEDYIRKLLWEKGALSRKNESVGDTIRRLCGPEITKKIEANSYHHSVDRMTQHDFFSAITYGENTRKFGSFGEETLLDQTAIDGFCFTYGGGPCALFRSADVLIPNKIYRRGENDDDKSGSYAIQSADKFDDLNTYTDVFRRSRKDYPDTNFNEKSIAGFTLVKKGDKGNWVNGRTGQYLSPIPLNNCAGFNPLDKSCQFTLGKYDFKMISLGYGQDLNVYVAPSGTNKWKELPGGYQKFLSMTNALLQKANSVNESSESKSEMETLLEDFMNGTFQDFKTKELPNNTTLYSRSQNLSQFGQDVRNGKNIFFYTCSKTENLDSMLKNGATYEFTGTSSDSTTFQGIVCYGSLSIAGAERNMTKGYGDTIYRFLLKDDISKYIIFDPTLRKELCPQNMSLAKQIREMCGDKEYKGRKLIDIIEKGLKGHYFPQNNHLAHSGIDGFDKLNPSLQGDIAAEFFQMLKGDLVGGLNGATQYDEAPLNMMGVHGYIYNGGNHWDCIGVRNYNALMPIAYATAKRHCDPTSIPRNEKGHIIWNGNHHMSEEWFDRLNKNVTARFQYGAEYNDTPLMTKQICGYTLVKGAKGYNYMDTKTHRHLLPIDVDNANGFNPVAKSASFNFLGGEWSLQIDGENKVHLMFKGHEVPSDKFMGLIKKAEGMNKLGNKTIHNDSLIMQQAQTQLNEGFNKTTNKGLVGGIVNLKTQEERLNSVDKTLFTDPKMMQIFLKLGQLYDSTTNAKKKKEVKTKIEDLIDYNDFNGRQIFVNDIAANFAGYAIFGTERRIDPDNEFSNALRNISAKEVGERSAKAQEKKDVGSRKMKMEAMKTIIANNSYHAFNFYTKTLGSSPIDLNEFASTKEMNDMLLPYFEKEPEYQTYMEIVNFLANLVRRDECAQYFFDGEYFYTLTYGKAEKGRIFPKTPSGETIFPPLWVDVHKFLKSKGVQPIGNAEKVKLNEVWLVRREAMFPERPTEEIEKPEQEDYDFDF